MTLVFDVTSCTQSIIEAGGLTHEDCVEKADLKRRAAQVVVAVAYSQ